MMPIEKGAEVVLEETPFRLESESPLRTRRLIAFLIGGVDGGAQLFNEA